MRTLELLDDVETLIELSEHISDWAGEQSVLWRFLKLYVIKHNNTVKFPIFILSYLTELCYAFNNESPAVRSSAMLTDKTFGRREMSVKTIYMTQENFNLCSKTDESPLTSLVKKLHRAKQKINE